MLFSKMELQLLHRVEHRQDTKTLVKLRFPSTKVHAETYCKCRAPKGDWLSGCAACKKRIRV